MDHNIENFVKYFLLARVEGHYISADIKGQHKIKTSKILLKLTALCMWRIVI